MPLLLAEIVSFSAPLTENNCSQIHTLSPNLSYHVDLRQVWRISCVLLDTSLMASHAQSYFLNRSQKLRL